MPAPPSPRSRSPAFAAAALLAACGADTAAAPTGPERLRDAPRPGVLHARRLAADSRELRNTSVLSHPALPIPPGRSAVWSAGISLALDALRPSDGSKAPPLGPGAPPAEAALLSGPTFPASAVDPSRVVVAAGRAGDGVLGTARRRMHAAFLAALPPQPVVPPDALVAAAHAEHDIAFAAPFDPSPVPLLFPGGKRVPAFGIVPGSTNPAADAVRAQVRVLAESYHRPADTAPRAFVLEVATAGGAERLVLARIPGEGSLEACWRRAADLAAAGPSRPLAASDILVVPKLHFSLFHRFDALGAAGDPGRAAPGSLALALQGIALRLEEGGKDAAPRPVLSVACDPRRFVLRPPFLLGLERRGAARPCLLLWIADGELLAEAGG